MKIIPYFIALLVALSACSNEQVNEAKATITTPSDALPLDQFLIGSWENLSLEIIVNTVNNTDSSYSILVPAGQWEEKLGVRPILTTYDTNNTYKSEYRTLGDSIYKTTRGIWNTFGDTLLLMEENGTYEYTVRYRDSLAEFQSFLDWDGDGNPDDSYRGVQKKRRE